MEKEPESIYIPPFANVRLIECRDFMALTPVVAYREFYGYGKIEVRDISREGIGQLSWLELEARGGIGL